MVHPAAVANPTQQRNPRQPGSRSKTETQHPGAPGIGQAQTSERAIDGKAPSSRTNYRGPKKSFRDDQAEPDRERRLNAAQELGQQIGISAACQALEVSRATLYRRRNNDKCEKEAAEADSADNQNSNANTQILVRALSLSERHEVLEQLNSERFCDHSPYQVYSKLLDEGRYLCSVRTMYRILTDNNAIRERRNQLTHPVYRKPELLATAPNQVWSWDITKLKGAEKWTYLYLYVIIDIFSRCVVGWLLAHRESTQLAKRLIMETITKEAVNEKQLTIHSDRGPSMKSHGVAHLLASLGVTKSHSRPHVSNDNPFSESHFKTLKYHRDFPDRFGCLEDGLAFCRPFFEWYNGEHYHSGIGFVTPRSLHNGQAAVIIDSRQKTLNQAYMLKPERFVRGCPKPNSLPTGVWINPPKVPPQVENESPKADASDDPQVSSLTHRRSDYPSAGCVPAEPASVSPDSTNIVAQKPLNTRVMPKKSTAPSEHRLTTGAPYP